MSAKHTPGPWSFAKYSNKRFGLGQRGQEAFFILQCVYDTADNPEARADARLIAAAPDLLEALKEAENALADYVPTLEKRGASLNYGRNVIRQASAAIAKAEGRS